MHLTGYEVAGCRAALGAMSAAIRAERILLDAGVSTQVVALERAETKRGCAFGVEFSCAEEARARAALRAARIPVSQFYKKG